MNQIDFGALREVFPPEELEWRVQQAGEKSGRVWAMVVPYVTNRAIQQRLDDVAGPPNWKNEFRAGPAGGVVCGLSVRVGDEWVTKWDGAENTEIEEVKGGLSGAMKRAAVHWGIGRYLYGLDETWAKVHDEGRFHGKTRDGKSFRWDPPTLPEWALPRRREQPAAAAADGTESLDERRAELEEMLQYIRDVGPTVGDDATIRIFRKTQGLKGFVRENWATIKERPRVARAVVAAIEEETGTPFRKERAAA